MKFFALVSIVLVAALGVGATAPDPDSACRCPKNCSHKLGSSCAFFEDGNTIKGACVNGDGGLTCST
ncbi:MAG: hypothetical protein NXY57DRAFT_963568 [Lentinula lateritia]|uniref:Uncharacterized protein n=1 Tax=Lentinula lateritia TaxID=40482 RepID=A0ABQ8VA31_9AGAR|nr:hypothetical protein EV359DRAFT_82016 [Lentinula novae-zelandiae]KAJ3929498.1 MAG: hypothetical protein NXY57DRAFT_963568 [Lentinula lateritia]KAJ4483111.1 hypothetical protein C8R41DRAFT_921917 [Lentinula lateritia]